MKKIYLLILIFGLFSCFSSNIENKDIFDETTKIEITNEQKLSDIKNLLKPNEIKKEENISKTLSGSEILISTGTSIIQTGTSIIQKDIKQIPKIKPQTTKITKKIIETKETSSGKTINQEQNIETGILTKEELDIIENTTNGEIDKLIDVLFKDLN